MQFYQNDDSTTGVALVNFQKFSEQLLDEKVGTIASLCKTIVTSNLRCSKVAITYRNALKLRSKSFFMVIKIRYYKPRNFLGID